MEESFCEKAHLAQEKRKERLKVGRRELRKGQIMRRTTPYGACVFFECRGGLSGRSDRRNHQSERLLWFDPTLFSTFERLAETKRNKKKKARCGERDDTPLLLGGSIQIFFGPGGKVLRMRAADAAGERLPA